MALSIADLACPHSLLISAKLPVFLASIILRWDGVAMSMWIPRGSQKPSSASPLTRRELLALSPQATEP
jgi:hypothetical protein